MLWIAIVVLLIFLGAILLSIEVFIIPGFGAIGIGGLLAVAGALVAAHLTLDTTSALWALSAGAGLATATVVLLPRTSLAKSVILHTTQVGSAAQQQLGHLVSEEGIAKTPLRPSGTAVIHGMAVDVVTTGGYVEPGQRICVVRVEGCRVIVKAIEEKQN